MKKRSTIIFYVLSLVLAQSCKQPSAKESICLIPKDYIGPVAIVFDVNHGAKQEIEQGKNVYRIPATGILYTQVKANLNIDKQEYFYVDGAGNRQELIYANFNTQKLQGKTIDEMTPDQVFAAGEIMTGVSISNNQDKRCRTFALSTKATLDSVLMLQERLPAKISGFDIWKK